MTGFRCFSLCAFVLLALSACVNSHKVSVDDNTTVRIAVYEALDSGSDSSVCSRPDIARAEIYSGDSSTEVVYYRLPAVMEEELKSEDIEYKPEYDGRAMLPFRFGDKQKWSRITGRNIGGRLAVSVNGRVVMAPRVMSSIEQGACSVFLTKDEIREILPEVDVEKLFRD